MITAALLSFAMAYGSWATASREVRDIICENVPFAKSAISAVVCFVFVGSALGIFLSLGCAPSSFLNSGYGKSWMRDIGRSQNVWAFRAKMIVMAAVILFMTALVV